MKRVLRTAQSFFPWFMDAKFATQYMYRALRHRPFEPEFAALNRLVPDEALCLDVGGNRGQSIQAIRMIVPKARIVSFEPNPMLFERLKIKMQGDENVVIRNEALGEKACSSTLYVPYYRKFMYDGLASLDEVNAREWICHNTFWNFRDDWVSVRAYPIRVVPLDAFSFAPQFIKIDVQGTELSVLMGGLQTIKQHRPVVMCEAPNSQTAAFLCELGYTEFKFVADKLVRGRGELNSIFIFDALY